MAQYRDYKELYNAFTDFEQFDKLLSTLGSFEVDKYDYVGFSLPDILDKLLQNANKNSRTKEQLFKDIFEMVLIGLVRGNIREDQLLKTEDAGKERIKELALIYEIKLKKSRAERSLPLHKSTMSFARSLACFPHVASLLIFKSPKLAREGMKTDLMTHELPDPMKHSGFCGLIPSSCHEDIQSILILGHVAYMLDFGRLINQGSNRVFNLKQAYDTQLGFSLTAQNNSAYTHPQRVGYLLAFGFGSIAAFRKIHAVANRLSVLMGKGAIDFTAVSKHITNDTMVYITDAAEQKKANDLATSLINKLIIADSGPSARAIEDEPATSGPTIVLR